MTSLNIISNSEKYTKKFAQSIAKNITNTKFIIYLSGDLGSGKTTFARGFIQFFGFDKVKSPTYSIVESYESKLNIYHFDLYRLSEFEELEMIGIREYFDNICLIEWADNFIKYLPQSDLNIIFEGNKNRKIKIIANTIIGEEILKRL